MLQLAHNQKEIHHRATETAETAEATERVASRDVGADFQSAAPALLPPFLVSATRDVPG
jgi:hypothetical protein